MGVFDRLLIVAIGLVGMPCQAFATPPDIIDVRDDLFGISRSSLFLLRITRDNLGLHTSEQRDVVLVAVDRLTGRETLWPVYRARHVPDIDRDGSDVRQKTEVSKRPNAVDPFAKLGESDGYPIGMADAPVDARADITIKDGVLTVTFPNGFVAKRKMSAVLSAVSGSLDKLADSVGDYERLAPIRTRDLLAGQSFEAQACKVSDPFGYDDRSGAPPVSIARVTCSDPEGQTASLLVTLSLEDERP